MKPAKNKTTRVRYKLLSSMFATNGYAALGASLIQPLLSDKGSVGVRLLVGIAIGMALQAASPYIAPLGEEP